MVLLEGCAFRCSRSIAGVSVRRGLFIAVVLLYLLHQKDSVFDDEVCAHWRQRCWSNNQCSLSTYIGFLPPRAVFLLSLPFTYNISVAVICTGEVACA